MGEREREQRATRPEVVAAGASIAGPRQDQLTSLAATANATAPVQRLKALSAQLNAAHANSAVPAQRAVAPPQPNRTGLPDRLKEGVEAMSGLSMDDVRVHRNSSQPAQLNAHAFAQGRDIHLAPGQERHLPHEAWHVVQQAQGRVRPTAQMKRDISINDDAALEHEADVMGVRASAGATQPATPESVSTSDQPAQLCGAGASPFQLKVDPNPEPIDDPKPPRFSEAFPDPGRAGIIPQIDWTRFVPDIYEILTNARLAIPEDSEEPEEAEKARLANEHLGLLEGRADALVTRGNASVVMFDRNRSGSVKRFEAIAEMGRCRAELTYLLAEIQETYRLTEGGFGAKGRAANVEGVVVNEGAGAGDDKFIKGISIKGEQLTNKFNVTKPVSPAAAGIQHFTIDGRARDLDPSYVYRDGMAEPPQSQQVQNIRKFVGMDRGRGQLAMMSGTNARGYAWATKTRGWQTTQWEWLHIRGASLGGATGPTNLVLGTRDSNTHMIPFESNLKSLALHATSNKGYSGVSATWTIAGRKHPHSYEHIKLVWTLHRTDGAVATQGEAEFSPLEAGGNALSKTEVEFLEDALSKARPEEDSKRKKRKKEVANPEETLPPEKWGKGEDGSSFEPTKEEPEPAIEIGAVGDADDEQMLPAPVNGQPPPRPFVRYRRREDMR